MAVFLLVIATAPQISASSAWACTSIIVGKNASPDGAVLLGHNEDDGNLCTYVKAYPAATHGSDTYYTAYYGSHVPYPANTLGYVTTKFYNKTDNPGDICSTLNSNQVAIVDNLAQSWTDDPDLNDEGPESGLIWSELNELAAMQATSARNAVQIIGSLVETYGLGLDTGTLLAVTDPDEGWWIEISGHQWCAQRVPDNAVEMRANAYGIGNVNLSDPANFLYSPDMVSFAQARNLPGCNNSPFNWQTSYMYPGLLDWGFNSQRLDMIPPKLAGYIGSQGYVSKQDLMEVLRWHYEGTSQFPTNNSDPNYCNDPWGGVPHTVCNRYTVNSCVTETRSWLPDCIGGVMWQAMRMPDQGVYVPWYAGITTTPTEYTTGGSSSTPTTSAYWAFNSLATWVHSNYSSRITGVQNAWNAFEASAFTNQAAAEATALANYNNNPATAITYLTNYSCDLGHQAFVAAAGRPSVWSGLAITTNPASQSVADGSSVTFTVAASGGTTPYSYQWYKNGTAVSGATSASYTFTAASGDNGATFYATVTDSATIPATVTSTTAMLTVTAGGQGLGPSGEPACFVRVIMHHRLSHSLRRIADERSKMEAKGTLLNS
jgi:dipeptidase